MKLEEVAEYVCHEVAICKDIPRNEFPVINVLSPELLLWTPGLAAYTQIFLLQKEVVRLWFIIFHIMVILD
jgi:hypothetical protein